MKRENRDGPAVLRSLPRPGRISMADIPNDAVLLDCRSWDEFRQGHRPGSLNAPLDRQFTTAVGSYIEPGRPIVLVADQSAVEPAVRRLVRVGLDEVAGFVVPADLTGATETIEEIGVEEARRRLGAGQARLLDVRRRGEFEEAHALGAEHRPHVRMALLADEIPADKPVMCMCRSGKRSARACALLQARGRPVINVEGGFLAWDAAGLPTE
jgi:hydroxyacylglutathione hydrolase